MSTDDTVGGKRGLFRNALSLIGAALAIVSLANIGFLILIDNIHPSPYLGIFAFMLLPALFLLGLLLIPAGMWLERRRRRHLAPSTIPRFPRLDLNVPAQRNAVLFFVGFSALFVALSAAGSYRAYEFTDSVSFCGQTCHTVMAPEYTTYLRSPHARVACVDCHVGSGASWYVKSKLSGSYQVYAATFHKFPRPIPTPVANLRPAQQTCEQCHWPRRFYGAQLKVFTHFANDEKNTPHQIRMLINIGGAEPVLGERSGIHWHMNIANQITFIATDQHRQTIPWVQARDQQGHVTVYVAKDSQVTQQQLEKMSKHVMDCIDCHNRPTHIFTPPDRSVDDALVSHRLDPAMPFVKQQATDALSQTYQSEAEATAAIREKLTSFYRTKYPSITADRVEQAVHEIQHIYSETIFPYMKVDWRTHPNNIGHYYFPGCFRCHDGQHVSSDGKVIPKQCDTCHTVVSQTETASANPPTRRPFKHPVDIGDLAQISCSDCHNGGSMP